MGVTFSHPLEGWDEFQNEERVLEIQGGGKGGC